MSSTPNRRSWARLAALSLALLLIGCDPVPPAETATPHTSPSASPTLSSSQATPGPTATPTPTVGPSPSPSPSPTSTPTASPALPSPTPEGSPEAGFEDRLQRVLDNQRRAFGIPGLGAAVLFADGTRWSGGSGSAQLEGSREASGDTPFVVGSVSKTFVAATIMQLAEEGVLGLDDRLSRWLPDYPRAAQITLRQLLMHTSGEFNYFEHPTYNRRVFGEPAHEWTPDEILTTFRAAPYFAPGTGYHYSNTGFVILGLVVEAATGNSLGDEYRQRFFEPLDMADTFFQGDGPPPSRAASGYLVGQGGPRLISDGTDYRPTTSAATVAWAAGAVVASASDLATWADALYGGGLLEPESLAQMTDFTANPYAGGAYGLGTRTRIISGRRVIGHTGSLRGFAASMWHFPHEGITVVVLSNRGRVDVNPIADQLAAAAFEAAGYGP
jgi:D-alanyl-D-alanine carboxypeptidase